MYPSKAEMGMIDKGPCFSNGGSSERWELDEAETVKNDTVSPPFHPAKCVVFPQVGYCHNDTPAMW